jgi:hypothetical protein
LAFAAEAVVAAPVLLPTGKGALCFTFSEDEGFTLKVLLCCASPLPVIAVNIRAAVKENLILIILFDAPK